MNRRGASLFELVLAVGLLSLLLLLLALFGPPIIRTWTRSSRLSEAQRSVMVGLQRIRAEMRQAGGVTLTCPSSSQIQFLSRYDDQGAIVFAPTGEPQWQKWVTFSWSSATQQLSCRYDPLAAPIVLIDVLTYTPSATGTDRLVCRNLEAFHARVLPSGILDVTLTANCDGEKTTLATQLAPLAEE